MRRRWKMSETEAMADVEAATEPKAEPKVFDSRSIVAFATAYVLTTRKQGIPAQESLYFWEEEDGTPDGVAVVPRQYKQVSRDMNNFTKSVAWKAPSHLLPSGSRPRYIRMEVIPEGVKVTHYLGFYGVTIIGLHGMPKGTNSTNPKVQYVTVSKEKFVETILFYLNQQ